MWPCMDVNKLRNSLCFSLADFFRKPGIFNSPEFGARNDARYCAVRHKCLNEHSVSNLGSNLHKPFVGEVCMISLERNEAQRAVLKVSIREKTNDSCVDKLRYEKELAKLVVGFTDGLETNFMYHRIHYLCKYKVQDNCGKGNEVFSNSFEKHSNLVLLAKCFAVIYVCEIVVVVLAIAIVVTSAFRF